jgi:hypothetical protein
MAQKAAEDVSRLLSEHADDETKVLRELSKNVGAVIEPVQAALEEIHGSRNDRRTTLAVVLICCVVNVVVPLCNFIMLQSIESQVEELQRAHARARLSAARGQLELDALRAWLGQSATPDTLTANPAALLEALKEQEDVQALEQLVATSSVFETGTKARAQARAARTGD